MSGGSGSDREDPLTHRAVEPHVRELALRLFDAFWAAVEENAVAAGDRNQHPMMVSLLRVPDCEPPPRLWVFMAEMLNAVNELPGYEVLGRDTRRWSP